MSDVLFDTHAHLDFHQFDADRAQVIYRALDSNVKGIINIGIDLKTSELSLALAEQFSCVYAAVGIHPHDAGSASEQDIVQLKTLYSHPKVVAIGEVGLDYYRNLSPPEIQKRFFRMFLDWAWELQLPLILHTRDAEDDLLSILSSKAKTGWQGVVHCFSGDQKSAEKLMEMGFHISFTGTVTFKKSTSAGLVAHIPLERLLLETDCPFMTPEPHRGKRNEPAFVNHILQKIAELQSIPAQRVAQITTKNAEKLFGIQLKSDV
jgi:TatD DNase family protein